MSGTQDNPASRAIGIMGAMTEETRAILVALKPTADPILHGGRAFHRGILHGREVVVVTSRCGKVSAAATATELIVRFDVRALLFTGVAGGVGPRVRVGDLVVASELIQHDMDARPLFPRHEIPLLGVSRFQADPTLGDLAQQLLKQYADVFRHIEVHIDAPQVHRGLVTSGDQFMATVEGRAALVASLPDALCVEMEGAAVAQVAHEYQVPLCVVRTISDMADGHAAGTFEASLSRIAADHAALVVKLLLEAWPQAGVAPVVASSAIGSGVRCTSEVEER